jgi:hypothetical protein
MATGDISREAFDPEKHYSGVRMQQGRVITDDDWNDNERIEDEDRRRARIDIIGPAGTPDNGFQINDPKVDEGHIDFKIEAGSYYLGGLRLEREKFEYYPTQEDWLGQPDHLSNIPDDTRYDLVYLEAWQQPVSAVEDSELFEVALGGPDTSTRVRNMHRVRIEPGVPDDCSMAWEQLKRKWVNEGKGIINEQNERVPDVKISVRFDDEGRAEDLCRPNIQGGYLGAENQAVRVQLTDTNHFTWGFDNASPLYRVKVAGSEVTMLTEPKDQAHCPLSGQVVEILPRAAVLPNGEKIAEIQGVFFKVGTSYNPDEGKLTLADSLNLNFVKEGEDNPDYLFMRVWNRGSDKTSDPEIPFTPAGDAVALGNTGLKVSFTGDHHVAGDYWIIAARPETSKKVVPWKLELEQGIPPNGVRRFYTPLAIIRWDKNDVEIEGTVVRDCRVHFRPLTRQKECCTFLVGDGKSSHGDFDSIEEAIRHLPENGGQICLLPGIYIENVTIERKQNIVIKGCDKRTVVMPADKARPIFCIRDSQCITLEHMDMEAFGGTGVLMEASEDEQLKEIEVSNNRILACIHAARVEGGEKIKILGNTIRMLDKESGDIAIFIKAEEVLIQDNDITVVPADDLTPDTDGPDDRTVPNPTDPCADPEIFIKYRPFLFNYVNYIWTFALKLNLYPVKRFKTPGGIQIAGNSDTIKIHKNRISGGYWNGITLGHIPKELEEELQFKKYAVDELADDIKKKLQDNFDGFIYNLEIEENRIHGMGLNGIGVVCFFSLKNIGLMVSVENITIYRNKITNCIQQMPQDPTGNMQVSTYAAVGGISLADCENLVVRENRIENNGESHKYPICGIYIHYGENVDISGNRILNNGPLVHGVKEIEIKPGKRGGIVIDDCVSFSYRDLKNAPSTEIEDELGSEIDGFTEVSGEFGIPALKVHDNIVTQPFGQALTVNALGPVSVVNNQFTTRDIDLKVNKQSLLGGAVYIYNLGKSQNWWGLLWLSLRNIKNASKTRKKEINFDGQNISFADYLNVARLNFLGLYYPCGNVMFNNNQTTLELKGKEISGVSSFDFDIAFSSQFICSQDDVSFIGNQSDCNFLLDFLFTNTAIFAVSTRISNNRFKEGLILALFSLFSVAMVNTTNFNQATHCLFSLGILRKEPQGNAGNILLFDLAFFDKSYCEKLNEITSNFG